jgi:hypothetical protein
MPITGPSAIYLRIGEIRGNSSKKEMNNAIE